MAFKIGYGGKTKFSSINNDIFSLFLRKNDVLNHFGHISWRNLKLCQSSLFIVFIKMSHSVLGHKAAFWSKH